MLVQSFRSCSFFTLTSAPVVNFTALDKVVVVERSGEYLKTHAEDSEALFLALVIKTTPTSVYR